ncbi:MAG: HD domain-containing protein [Chloroflexota bacterium]|nr:MAG: HD domain-containing protein [Chloroflexota bacterium]
MIETNTQVASDAPADVIGVDGQQAEALIRVPCRHNPRLQAAVEAVNEDRELHALWRCANINAVDRLGISDHGRVHVQIVSNVALRLLRLLVEGGVQPSVVRHHGLEEADAEVIVFLAAMMHDVGIAIHRDRHEELSPILAAPRLSAILARVPDYDVEAATIISSEILHAIVAHARDAQPLTLEAGIVKVADALDMAKGRSRIPLECGKVNIHSISAAAVERVVITRGDGKPVRVEVQMNNSAGIFQVGELLRGKLDNSGLAEHLEVVANVQAEAEKRLIPLFRL